MNNFSLVEKLKILVDVISKSPLFLFCSMFSVALLIYFLVSIKRNKKINKWIFISIWIFLMLVLIIYYNSIVFNAIDKLFDMLFIIIFFPNLLVYILIVVLANLSLVYSLFGKNNRFKIINFIDAIIINLLLVLVIDIIKTNNINIYDELNLYSNQNLLVLVQLTSATFISWILINLLVTAKEKLKKYDKNELPPMKEIVFEDIC